LRMVEASPPEAAPPPLLPTGCPHYIKVYPEAGHGFRNEHPPEDMTPLTILLRRRSRTRYHQPSAQDARRCIIAFFNTRISPQGMTRPTPRRGQRCRHVLTASSLRWPRRRPSWLQALVQEPQDPVQSGPGGMVQLIDQVDGQLNVV
jgi:hypothetical protein